MRRAVVVALGGLGLVFAGTASAAEPSAVEVVGQTLDGFKFDRYMEQDCADQAVDGWAGFSIKLCKYTVSGASETAEVVLLDADDAQLVRWIASACVAAKANDVAYCARKLARHIRGQSGAQFPVAGMVLEDMDGDGKPNQFAFRDGVTVSVKGVTGGKSGGPSAAENQAAIANPPLSAKRFARIASTTREQFVAYVGAASAPPTDGLAWLTVVREAYRRAWGADGNDLINAWAVANPDRSAPGWPSKHGAAGQD